MKTIDQILKIKAVVLYILKAFPEGVDYIHLFKVMYFAQQNQLKEYGLPIIYDTFVARKHGPVPAQCPQALRCVQDRRRSPLLCGTCAPCTGDRQRGRRWCAAQVHRDSASGRPPPCTGACSCPCAAQGTSPGKTCPLMACCTCATRHGRVFLCVGFELPCFRPGLQVAYFSLGAVAPFCLYEVC